MSDAGDVVSASNDQAPVSAGVDSYDQKPPVKSREEHRQAIEAANADLRRAIQDAVRDGYEIRVETERFLYGPSRIVVHLVVR